MPDLASLLTDYRSRYPGETAVVDLFEDFLQTGAFRRSCRHGHFTGSAWIVDAASKKVLLTHHVKLGRWLQPGGHADGETDLAAVALREAREETALAGLHLVEQGIFDLDRHPIPVHGDEPEHFHYDVRFLVRCGADESFTVSDESHDLAWVPLADIRRYSERESILRMVRKTRPGGEISPL